MDRMDRRIFHRIRAAFQGPVLRISPNPALRRRLYGAFFALTATALAPLSAEMIGDQRLARWLQQNPPGQIHWMTAARARDLAPVRESALRNRLLRHPPEDGTPGTVWWNPETQSLWIIPSSPTSESELPEDPWIFSRVGAAPPKSAQRLRWMLLGLGWQGFEQWTQLELAPPAASAKPRASHRGPPADPRQWHF